MTPSSKYDYEVPTSQVRRCRLLLSIGRWRELLNLHVLTESSEPLLSALGRGRGGYGHTVLHIAYVYDTAQPIPSAVH